MAENISVFFSLLHNAFFFFFFWPHRTGGVILVPRPGIKLGPSAVKVWSPNHWTAREFPTMPLFKNIFIQFLKVTFHLQLSQNIGYIPHVVQYILVAYLTPNGLYLLLPYPYIAPPPSLSPLVITSLFYVCESASFLLYSLVCCIFLDSTCKWCHTVFVFLFLTYFTIFTIGTLLKLFPMSGNREKLRDKTVKFVVTQ